MDLQAMSKKFTDVFGEKADGLYFAPGRVNLIGEHTDYNGGHVFPCALTFGIYGLIRRRADRTLRFFSMNFPEAGLIESSLDSLIYDKKASWTNYPKGVLWAMGQRGVQIPSGFDFLINGDIPSGAGLSSSAALEVLTGLAVRDTFGLALDMTDLALLGQKTENDFCGLSSGIMDQFASAMGKKDSAIFLDTQKLEYAYVPLALKHSQIVITNSNVKHSLVSSAYNERRQQCAKALSLLQMKADIKALCDLKPEQFEQIKGVIGDPVITRRAKHAVYEDDRTVRAVECLKKNDIRAFGQLMNESHISLRDDYETSCPETDLLAEIAWSVPGVYGSRITGGGFGGCTVSIIDNDAIDAYKAKVDAEYEKKTGKKADIYVASVGDGAHRIE
ncbi:MAG: galactokinase [Lachnospiraceae bacterium]|jgi:galactokinase|nr:galactokinase [Lachnospiraceae bacterium]MCH4030625.1 galactokinase [Lachnospiraceae bacterium]MCH4069834.1 galactokinase [Lachnospiraceae bacterium]MCH4107227.1 galactokinase [Lachnospiraceae bacterium]MCI1301918.1 galactokinase [Lachnospiraceae bacterium]